MDNKNLKEIRNFLGAYFHQDITSYDDVLEEFLRDEHTVAIESTVTDIRNFLSCCLPINEKEEIIKNEVFINFEYYHITPLAWLQYVLRVLECGLADRKQKIHKVERDFKDLKIFLENNFNGDTGFPWGSLAVAIKGMSSCELKLCIEDVQRFLQSDFPLEYKELFVAYHISHRLTRWGMTTTSWLQEVRKRMIIAYETLSNNLRNIH